ncbi:formin-J-like [Sinocyclocheilus anshuiensis]|uniref:formin-J-like n=1 Tax=Sinocyclocheilus anshuiensis TaxID=1608454 RepID=UPI0007BA2936|nr:PREDICTED: formin-J-like [Sinocyclocheilus anshuiensis]
MDYRKTVFVPQLSNEMQLNVMNWVKSGKMSIDEVLIRANNGTLHKQRNFELEEKQSQYNFSVRKFNRYIWQKRVLQIDFSTSLLCSIEKGIVKRQLCFSEVKNCHDAPGTRFSISFRDRSDYELEAASLEDKQQIMQLVNQVIYSNIYSPLVNGNSVEMRTSHLPPTPDNLKEGHLLLQRGGLASFKWKTYEANLQTGQLTLFPVTQQSSSSDAGVSVSSSESVWSLSEIYASVDDIRCTGGDGAALVIHLSDGNVRVDTPCNTDTFTLHNDKNDFVFRIPKSDYITPQAITNERDAWVKAIKQLCVDWKRKSHLEHFYEAPEKDFTDVTESESKTQDNHVPLAPPPVPHSLRPRLPKTSPNVPAAPEPETASLEASEAEPKPTLTAQSRAVRKPGRTPSAVPVTSPVATCSSPAPFVLPPPLPVPSAVPGPAPPAPLPPPLPMKSKPLSERTKAFHWDLVAQDKIEKSMWSRRNPRKIEIDSSRLYELFGVRERGRVCRSESISTVEIMLNSKIAHNFSKYVPTPDDIEMYKSHKGDPSELHVVDQYMMEMCSILNLSTRLDLLLTMRELPICMEDLTPLIIQKIHMCQQLWACDSFVSMLEYLLAVGNYLNQNAGKDRAKGFRLSSLTKRPARMKPQGGVEGGRSHGGEGLDNTLGMNNGDGATGGGDPDGAEQTESQGDTKDPKGQGGAEGSGDRGGGGDPEGRESSNRRARVTPRIQMAKAELKAQATKAEAGLRKAAAEPERQRTKAAIEKHEADLRQLMKRCEEMRKLYTDILIKFGEPLDQDSQEVFGWICQFISDFKKVYSEYAQ